MALKHAARHLSIRGRMAHRRIRQVLERAGMAQGLGPATGLFSVLSLLSHVVLTWGVVTFEPALHPDAANDPLVTSRFLYPLMKREPRPQAERVRFVGIGGPQQSSAPTRPREGAEAGGLVAMAAEVEDIKIEETISMEPYQAFSELEVDETAERSPDSEGPVYPDSLLARQIEGEARVRFVIDAEGRAIPESFAVIESSHAGFTRAVRLALPRMKFKPASMGSKPVAQRVEQTFVFKITQAPPVP
jgi:protein TonB